MQQNPVVVEITGLSKRFILRKDKTLKERLVNFGRSRRHKEDFYALRDVNIEIRAGSTVGLIGPNGSGKSTLLKIIGGILQPTAGTVRRRGRLAALLELGAGFHPDLTGRENVYLNASILGLSRHETDKYFDEIVAFSGIGDFIDTQVKFYSSGMYVRLAFSVAVHVDPDVLLVDEVLAVGDEPFQQKCLDRIRLFQSAGKTIIIVTHSLDIVADLCDRAILLEHGKIEFDGQPADALSQLRADFEGQRRTEFPMSDPIIHSVRVDFPEVDSLGRSAPASTATVTVEVDLHQEIPDWVVGIGIETTLGQTVYGTNTRLIGYRPRPLSGKCSVVFELPELQLAGGLYYIHAAFATDRLGQLSRVERAATISIEETPRQVGSLYVEKASAKLAQAVN